MKDKICLLDETLDKTKLRDYILKIYISLYEISYTIYDTQRNKFAGFENFFPEDCYNEYVLANKFEEIINDNPWLRGNFSDVKIIYHNPSYTFVPAALFDEKEKDAYFNFNHNLRESENLYCEKTEQIDAYNLYPISSALKNKIKEIFPVSSIRHYMSILTDLLININKNNTVKTTTININKNSFDMLIIENNKLLYTNTFKISNEDDLAYHLLFAMQQNELNPENAVIKLMGYIDKLSAYYEIINKYIRNIDFVDVNAGIDYSYALKELAKHKHLALMAI